MKFLTLKKIGKEKFLHKIAKDCKSKADNNRANHEGFEGERSISI